MADDGFRFWIEDSSSGPIRRFAAAGFTPESVVDAVAKNDFTLLKHGSRRLQVTLDVSPILVGQASLEVTTYVNYAEARDALLDQLEQALEKLAEEAA